MWLAGSTVAGLPIGLISTAGTTGKRDCCDGAGGIVVEGIEGFVAGSGDGMETPGAVDGAGTDGITGMGGSTDPERPGAAGATGFSGMIRGGSDEITLGGMAAGAEGGGVGRLVAGMTGAVDFFEPNRRPRIPGRFSSGGAIGVEAAGTVGTGAGSRLKSLPPKPRFPRCSSTVGTAAVVIGFTYGVSANALVGGLAGRLPGGCIGFTYGVSTKALIGGFGDAEEAEGGGTSGGSGIDDDGATVGFTITEGTKGIVGSPFAGCGEGGDETGGSGEGIEG
jgi:hypothetical protein